MGKGCTLSIKGVQPCSCLGSSCLAPAGVVSIVRLPPPDHLPADSTPILPAHIEETVQAIARLHADHYARASPLQKAMDALTAGAGRPSFIVGVTAVVLFWIMLNVGLAAAGFEAPDGPPFAWLQGAVGLGALYMTALILTTQRREDQLASHREQLTLELGILSEQKTAKIIQLLEELRRDNPIIPDRIDDEAEALSAPADPQAVLEAIKETHDALAEEDAAPEAVRFDTA